jgi:Bacterial PH domain
MKAVNLEKLLPGDIPQGEKILWHGRPRWVSLARRAYRSDFVVAYFVALTVWNCVSVGRDTGWIAASVIGAKTLGIGGAALALLAVLAYTSARTTLYVVTTRRLVLKVGIALPIFINLPFTQIVSAAARLYSDGTGDIPVATAPSQRLAYFALWPHARPFHFRHPEPALRCVANGVDVAETVRRALREAAGQTERAHRREIRALAEPSAGSATLPKHAVA